MDNVLDVLGMREHVDRLNASNLILLIEQLQVTCLRGRIAADIDDTLGRSEKDGIDDVLMHACARRIGDDYIWSSMLLDEVAVEDVLHVACEEKRVLDTINLAIDFSVLDGFRNILYTNDLTGLACHEIGDGACTCIKVVDELASRELSKVARYLI